MGIRVVKTAIACMIAVYLANYFSLTFPLAAGLLAVLGVDVTRKKTLANSFERIISSILGLLFAVLIFWIFGFYVWVLGLFVCVCYPILSKVKLKDGVVSSSVVAFHVFSLREVSFDIVMNEVWLLLIGLGAGSLINFLYMPNFEKKLVRIRQQVEDLLSKIFIHLASHLKDSNYIWDGSELIELEKAIDEGTDWAKRLSENAIFKVDDNWMNYFHMRKQHLESTTRMMHMVAQVYENIPHSEITAELFLELSNDVRSEYYTGNVEKRLRELEQKFKQMTLPSTREEFEIRSALLQLIVELKHYLLISKREKKKKEAATQPSMRL